MGDEKRIAIKVNADNDSLLPLSNGVFVIGSVDEVNGAGAEQMAFMPTRHELLQLVKYWTREILEIRYFWFLSGVSDSTEIRVEPFALRRIDRIADLLGVDLVNVAFDEAEDEFRKKCDPRHWEIFKHGSEAEWTAVRDEIHGPGPDDCDGVDLE